MQGNKLSDWVIFLAFSGYFNRHLTTKMLQRKSKDFYFMFYDWTEMRLMGECGVCQEASSNVASFACVMERENFMVWNAFRMLFKPTAVILLLERLCLMGSYWWVKTEKKAELLVFHFQRKPGKLLRFIFTDSKFIKDLLVDSTLF